ncbi:MAG TPA: rhomboid family intramembrane serine protease [Candidatus Saccharimonadales bacterium]|nr:rhomboid family intramembrane serine protease [Candidatus Saccharimonadales bacterium]
MLIPIGTEEPVRRRRLPIVTTALILVNVAAFALEITALGAGGEQALSAFIGTYGVVPASLGGLTNPDLITSLFLHGGFAHLLFNMLFLAAFGDNIEEALGRISYLLFYLVSGVLASLTHIWFNPASTVPTMGASGAIAGILGAYLVLQPRGRVKAIFFFGFFVTVIAVPAMLFILFWFAAQLFTGIASLGVDTAQTGGVAYWAHIGGFVAGLVLVMLWPKRRLAAAD